MKIFVNAIKKIHDVSTIGAKAGRPPRRRPPTPTRNPTALEEIRMTRLPELDPATMTEDQRRAYDAIASGPRGGVRGPLAVWVLRPALSDRAQTLGRYVRYDSSLSPNLSELAILITARVWGSEYEWRAHKPIALEAGVDPAVVEAIRLGRRPAFENDEERIVWEFATTLNRERRVPDAIYDKAIAVLGLDRTIDLVGVLGYYTLISMTINTFELKHPSPGPDELGPAPG